jgi:hypothetical protein
MKKSLLLLLAVTLSIGVFAQDSTFLIKALGEPLYPIIENTT